MVDTVITDVSHPIRWRRFLSAFNSKDETIWSRAASWLRKLHAFAPQLSEFIERLARRQKFNC